MSARLPMLPAPPVSEWPVALATIKAQMFAALIPCILGPAAQTQKDSLDDLRIAITKLEATMAEADIAPFSVAAKARWTGQQFVVLQDVPHPMPLLNVPRNLRVAIMEMITSMDIVNMPRRDRPTVIVRRRRPI